MAAATTGPPKAAKSLSSTIHSTKLKGHKGAVLCLDHSSSAAATTTTTTSSITECLLSGSEDKTGRLWDLKSCRAAHCFVAGDEVVSVAFGIHATAASIQETLLFARNYTV